MFHIYSAMAIAFIAWLLSLFVRRRRLPLPPGPKGLPIIGNVYGLPHEYKWLTYSKWAEKYGDVMSYSIFGHTEIVLNSLEAVTELLEKRSANYSDRPRMVMANELIGWGWNFGHMGYTDQWREHRRMFHQHFQSRNMVAYYPMHKRMLYPFLETLVHSPDDFSHNIRQYVGSIALQAAYGYETREEQDFYVELVRVAMDSMQMVVHANYLVEYVPWLKYIPAWMPGAGFKRQAQEWARKPRELCEIPFEKVKKLIADGSAQRSFVYDHLDKEKMEENGDINEYEETTKNCAAVIYLGGSDTTASLLLACILALAINPDVQRRCQEEITQLLGPSRLPDFSDRESLTYVQATLIETLRCFSVTPLALPHKTVKEDVYDGFRIPAGSTIIANPWAILRDKRYYSDPSQFKPERFIKNGCISFESAPDPLTIGAFGYGRRSCPGRYLALNTAWIALASMLATFDITKAVDKEGNVIEPIVGMTDGLVCHPTPFQVQFSPRFENVLDIIDAAKASGA